MRSLHQTAGGSDLVTATWPLLRRRHPEDGVADCPASGNECYKGGDEASTEGQSCGQGCSAFLGSFGDVNRRLVSLASQRRRGPVHGPLPSSNQRGGGWRLYLTSRYSSRQEGRSSGLCFGRGDLLGFLSNFFCRKAFSCSWRRWRDLTTNDQATHR
jgi:hypothetical protein